MLSIPQLGREVFLLPLLLCHVSVWRYVIIGVITNVAKDNTLDALI